jgi:hypothetical protein
MVVPTGGEILYELMLGKESKPMDRMRWYAAGLALVGAIAGCATTGELDDEVGQAPSALTASCSTDQECASGYVCAPAGICVRPSSCTTGASGTGVLEGSLVIDATDTSLDVQSLGGAWCVTGDLSIKKTALVDLADLSSLVAVGGTVSVEDNPSLTSLHGLENVRRVMKLSLFRNASLESLGALSRLKTLSSLQVYVNPKLIDLGGLQGVAAISWAEVVNNAGLTSLTGLHSINSVYSYLDVRQNPLLADVKGLDAVVSVGNLVQVTDNPKLRGLEGLGNLASIGSTLRVLRNPLLASLNALGKLTSARTFQVADNAQLDSCNVTDLATHVAADCSGCVRNGPCVPPDLCPADPVKQEPGVCGCGVPDTDTDGDAKADCVDPCPNDSPDDSDLDGVCTSVDRCPGFDDHIDADLNGIPDGCQECVVASSCDDANACTTDSCTAGACVHTITEGTGCGTRGTCSAAGVCVEPTCEFEPLGFLSTVQRNSSAFAVSDDGLTVTGRSHVGGGFYRGFRWTQAAGMVRLSSLTSSGRAISADGSKIAGIGGSELNATSQYGFRERPTYTETTATNTRVWALSADGVVAVGQQNGYAMRWTEGFSPEPMALGFQSQANGISADGSIIVGRAQVPGPAGSDTPTQAFVLSSAGLIGLGDFTGSAWASSEANAVSPSGQIVVGQAAVSGGGTSHGFRWTQDSGLVSLGPGYDPRAVTDTGMIVGEWNGVAYVFGSSLGDGSLKTLLEGCGVSMTGWALIEANDVTPDGRTIVGTGYAPTGQYEAVLIRLP